MLLWFRYSRCLHPSHGSCRHSICVRSIADTGTDGLQTCVCVCVHARGHPASQNVHVTHFQYSSQQRPTGTITNKHKVAQDLLSQNPGMAQDAHKSSLAKKSCARLPAHRQSPKAVCLPRHKTAHTRPRTSVLPSCTRSSPIRAQDSRTRLLHKTGTRTLKGLANKTSTGLRRFFSKIQYQPLSAIVTSNTTTNSDEDQQTTMTMFN